MVLGRSLNLLFSCLAVAPQRKAIDSYRFVMLPTGCVRSGSFYLRKLWRAGLSIQWEKQMKNGIPALAAVFIATIGAGSAAQAATQFVTNGDFTTNGGNGHS